jgi:hypothetical protein
MPKARTTDAIVRICVRGPREAVCRIRAGGAFAIIDASG